jgi:hypothetical protein
MMPDNIPAVSVCGIRRVFPPRKADCACERRDFFPGGKKQGPYNPPFIPDSRDSRQSS